MDELVELIVDKYDGSLKAEHGTGLNMAPYVEREWGAKATEMMWRIKAARRPGRRARPGRGAEPRPRGAPAQPEVDAADRGGRRHAASSAGSASRSARAGTSPRRRASGSCCAARWRASPRARRCCDALLERVRVRRRSRPAPPTAPACSPARSAIDTGKLIKELRRASTAAGQERVALRLAKRWGAVERAARGARSGGRRPAAPPLRGAARPPAPRCGAELVPEWPANMPRPAPGRAARRPREPSVTRQLPYC